VSVALAGGAVWAWMGEHGWPAPSAVLRVYGPVLAALHWYSSEPVGNKALAVLLALVSLLMVVTLVMFSFKVNLEELAVVVMGIPFYLLIAIICFLAVGLGVSLIRLL